MAVFTEVREADAARLLKSLGVGELQSLRGIQGGIENTNYFVTSVQGGERRDWVLTLFERLTHEQLPFYLHLMKHLAQRGIPVPEPHADGAGNILHTLCGKPAALVNKLPGTSELAPGPAHCAQVGDMLARMHLAGRDYERSQPNLRGLTWWNETVPLVLPHLAPAQAALLVSELAYQNHVAQSAAYAALPRGPVHADLFRDNVMFQAQGAVGAVAAQVGEGSPRLGGFFDFYFAGVDSWLFDVAVCLNDWCIDLATGTHNEPRACAFLAAYTARRPFSGAERQLLAALLRAGALRFWISRLWDFHLPREAALLTPHDPTHFERVLRQRVAHPVQA